MFITQLPGTFEPLEGTGLNECIAEVRTRLAVLENPRAWSARSIRGRS